MQPPTELGPDVQKRLLGLAFAKVAEHAVQDGRYDQAQRLCMSGALLAGDPKMTAIPELARISFEAIAQSRARCRLIGHGGPLKRAMFCLNDNRVVTLAADLADRTARLWDASSGRELLGTEAVEIDLSGDSKTFITRSRRGEVHVWDADSGRPKGSLSIPGQRIDRAGFLWRSDTLFSISQGGELTLWDDAGGAYAPRRGPSFDLEDGESVVTIGHDNSVVITSAWDGLRVRHLDAPALPFVLLEGHEDEVHHVGASRHGTRIVSIAYDRTLRLWDPREGRELLRVDLADDVEGAAAFSPDGKVLLVKKDEEQLALFNAYSGQSIAVLEEAGNFLFSPDSRLIATRLDSGRVRLSWSRDGGESVSFQSGTAPPSVMLFSPDSGRIAIGERSGLIRVFDTNSGEAIFCLNGHGAAVSSLAFSSDGRRLLSASADGEARIWCARSGYEVDRSVRHGGAVRQIRFDAAHGLRLVTASNDKTARIWSPLTPTVGIGLVGHTGAVAAAEFSPDGAMVVTASEDGTARLWNSNDGKEVCRFEGHRSRLWQASFSPDGSHVVTTSADWTARLWDPSNGGELWSHRHRDWFVDAAFSRDSTRLMTVSSGFVHVWDLRSLTEVPVTHEGNGQIRQALLSPDGHALVTADLEGRVVVWNIEESRTLASLNSLNAEVRSISLTENGQLVLAETVDGAAHVWSWASTQKPVEIRARKPIWGGAFSPDASIVAARYGDDEIGVWDAESGLSLCFLGITGTAVSSIAFSPDGAYLGSGSANGAASVWHLAKRHVAGKPPADIVVAALANGLAELTSVETEDPLVQAIPRDLITSVLSQGGGNIGLERSKAFAALSAPPHPNCFLSPWQLYGEH